MKYSRPKISKRGRAFNQKRKMISKTTSRMKSSRRGTRQTKRSSSR